MLMVMLKILQARLKQNVNRELPDVQLDLEKQRNQRSYGLHSLDHREGNGISEKHLLLFHIEYVKAFDYVYHATYWKHFKEMGIPDHLIVS